MLFITTKNLYQLQIAMKLDEYLYEKDTQGYFERMPYVGLVDSQVSFINDYLEILEYKDTTKKKEFATMLQKIKSDNAKYQELLDGGSKSSIVKKYFKITAYLIRQIEKYDNKFKTMED